MKKFALALMASAAMVLGLGVVANAYPPGGATITQSATTAAPGGSLTVSVSCVPGETATFTLVAESDVVTCGAAGTASVLAISAAGLATGTVTVPTAAGTYTGSITGSVTPVLGSFEVTVAAPATPGGGLPATGSDGTGTMTLMALGLFAVGGGLFGVSRFRNRTVAA